MSDRAETLVAVATYNEMEALTRLIEDIFHHAPEVHVLVVDDNSPDGTGRWCQQQAESDGRLNCLHREAKLGLGTATIAGLRYALDHGYRYVVNMDADLSHDPRYLPELLAGVQKDDESAVDVMIGSRYVAGGGVSGWPLRRRVTSRFVNFYARCLLGLPMKDCSGSYRCYRVASLTKLDFDAFRSRGYSVFEELLWRLKRVNARFREVPIVFVDREEGRSKITLREGIRSLWTLSRLGLTNWIGV